MGHCISDRRWYWLRGMMMRIPNLLRRSAPRTDMKDACASPSVKRHQLATLALLGLLSVPGALAGSQSPSGGEFKLRRATIDGGGGEATGGQYFLQGTIGQYDTGGMSDDGEFKLRGGFWTPSGSSDLLLSDGFEG